MKTVSKGMIYLGLMCLCLLLCFGGAVAQTGKATKDAPAKDTPAKDAAVTQSAEKAKEGGAKEAAVEAKDFVVEELSKIDYDNPDFKVQVATVSGRRAFRVGDRIDLKFRANRDAYVTILDVGSSGKVHVLFPNKWDRDNYVKAGKWYQVPPESANYALKVHGPRGVNYVKAIATRERYDFVPRDAQLTDKSPFYEVAEPKLAVKDIGAELEKRDRKDWAEYQSKLRIVEEASWRDDDRDMDRDPDRDWDRGRDRDRDSDRDGDRGRDRYRGERSERDRDLDRGRDYEDSVVKLWTDRKRYRIGEPVRFYFYSERDCYLNLVSFGSSGKVRVIFPNRFQKDNFVRGGKVVEIPTNREDEFMFRVEGPAGRESVRAIATRNKYKVYRGDYNWDRYAYQVWEDAPEKIEEDIRVRLDEIPDRGYQTAKTSFKVER
ncbi:MAG: DUF4384 domain-containing protein [Desulfomonile tiedjei]|nr:DUF4384 domain-containing protein [Desulfomonile tiedjei]